MLGDGHKYRGEGLVKKNWLKNASLNQKLHRELAKTRTGMGRRQIQNKRGGLVIHQEYLVPVSTL